MYDAVVLDAPPTGRIGRFLNVTAETARLAKVGPIKTQSEGVAALLRSPMTAVHVVTLLEEMPVQETVDAIAELHRAGHPGRQGHRQRRPAAAADRRPRSPRPSCKRGLAAAGLPADRATVAGLLAEAKAHLTRRELEERCAPSWPSWAGRWSSCRCCRRASTGPGWTSSPSAC